MGAGIGAAFGLIGSVVQGIGASNQVKANAAQMYAQAGQVIACREAVANKQDIDCFSSPLKYSSGAAMN